MNTSNWKHTYIAIDLKSFYASVECVERGLNPLTTNLVVADASRTEKTICLAVTPSLKKYGLSGRSRLFEVIEKAKEVEYLTKKKLEYITAVPRMSLYIKYSAEIYNIYLKYFAPEDIHVYSIDEVFIDATSYLSFYKLNAEELTRKVIQDILTKTGITATAGIAPNLYLCKIAMDIVAKHSNPDKNGVRIAFLDEIEFRKQLWNHRPLTDFWRIGSGTTRRLEKACIFTMGDLARRSLTDSKSLYKIFGIDAEILIDHAWGYEPCTIKDIKSYKSKANSLSSGQVLTCPYTISKARLIIKEMSEVLLLDMFEKNISAQSYSLYIGYDHTSPLNNYHGELVMDYYGKIIPKPATGTVSFNTHTNLINQVEDALLKLFDRIITQGLYVRRITLCANNIVNSEYVQPTLFDNSEEIKKEQHLEEAVVDIQKKYGKNAILKGHCYEEGGTTILRNSQIGGHRA